MQAVVANGNSVIHRRQRQIEYNNCCNKNNQQAIFWQQQIALIALVAYAYLPVHTQTHTQALVIWCCDGACGIQYCLVSNLTFVVVP